MMPKETKGYELPNPKPTLQLDNHQILSIDIFFHTQHHIDKSAKELSNPQRDKESMSLSR